jgi:hypothetical protein
LAFWFVVVETEPGGKDGTWARPLLKAGFGTTMNGLLMLYGVPLAADQSILAFMFTGADARPLPALFEW